MEYSELSMEQIDKEITRQTDKADRLLEIVEDEETSKKLFDQALAELAINRKELQKLYSLRKTIDSYR